MKFIVIGIVLLVLQLAVGQTIIVPAFNVVAGSCSSYTITDSQASATPITVTLAFDSSNGLTVNGSSSSATITIPANSQSSGSFNVCTSSASNSFTTVVNASSNSTTYTINGGSATGSVNAVVTKNFALPNANVTIPKGGCSATQTVTLSAAPTSSLTATFNALQNTGYYIKDFSNTTTLTTFNTSQTTYTFKICSFYNNTTPLNLSPTLSGVSASEYSVNNGNGSSLSLAVVSANASIAPNLDLNAVVVPLNSSTTACYVYFTSELAGNLYYTIRAPDDPSSTAPSTPMPFTYVQTLTAGGSQVRPHNQSDFLSYLNTNNRDLRVNRTGVNAGINNYVLIDTFNMPGETYEVYLYFLSYDSVVSIPTGQADTFVAPTLTWPVYNGGITFATDLTREQRGSLLYWLQNNISAPANFLVNLRGESAPNAPNSQPNRPWYIYDGSSEEAGETQTIYLLTEDEGSTSTYVINWNNLWSGGSLTASAAAAISSAVGVNVTTGTAGATQNFTVYRGDTAPTATTTGSYYQSGNISVNASFSGNNGILYAGVAGPTAVVSAENLINCVDTSNTTALLACNRVVFRPGETASFNFSSVAVASGYKLYTVVSNAYVRRPMLQNVANSSAALTGSTINLVSGVIGLPSTVLVVAGNCVPVPVTLLSAPFTAVNISGASSTAGVSVNQSFATVNGGATTGTVGVCALSTATGSYTVNFTPGGADASLYKANSITVTVVPYYNATVPSGTINVPRGGCSSVYSTSISNIPTNDVSVNFSSIAGTGYYVADVNGNAASFDNTGVLSRDFRICSYYNTTTNTTVTTALSGTNAGLYSINNGNGANISLVQVNAVTIPTVVLTTTNPVNSTSTNEIVTIDTDLEGYLYYTVRSPDDTTYPPTPLNASAVGTYLNSTNLGTEVRLHNQSDFLTYLYSSNRDLRLNGSHIIAGANNQLLVNKLLLPGLNYEVCKYFQAMDLSAIVPTGCENLTVASRVWPVYETAFQFNSTLSREQRNNLLKWLYTTISAPINNVINLRGETANTSGGSWPSRPYYVYNGSTNDSSNTQTLYLITEDNGANSSDVTNLYNLFSGANNTLNSSSLSSLSSAVGVNSTAASIIGYQPYMVQRNDTNRVVTTSSAVSSYNNNSVTITNFTITGGNGIIYFGLAPANSSLSAENLTNCVTSSGSALIGCSRSALRSGQNATIVISNVTSNGTFQLYNTYTNAYLLRPILLNNGTSLSGSAVTLGNNYVTTNPSTITLAAGACQDVNVTVGTWPYTNVTITGVPSNSNVSVSNGIVIVNGQPTTSTVRVCAVSGSSTGSSTITWSFSGPNAGDYTTASTPVSIVAAAGDISVPTAVTVPVGGCANNFIINSTGLASSDVFIATTGNNNYYFPNATDFSTLHFNQSSGTSYYNTTVCSYASSTGGPIPIYVGGVNSNVFTVNGGNSTNVSTTQTDPPSPSIYFQANPIKYNDGTNVTISVVSNRQGWVYYALTEGVQNTSIWTLQSIMNHYNTGNYYVWNQSAFNTHLYSYGREAWINRTIVYAGRDNWVNHTGLQPATIYTICGYYSNDNQTVTSTQASCSQFLTNNISWPIYKGVFNFSRQLTNTERNRLLCYLVSVVSPMYNRYLTNLRSESCNTSTVNSTTASEWYNYTGQTSSINGTEVIYLLTQDNGTASSATTNFLNLFDPNTNNSLTSTSSAISSVTGVTLTGAKYDGSVAVGRMKISNRTLYFVKPSLSGSTLTISNMTIRGGHGVVYMGVAPTSTSSTPTPEQLINCVNGNTSYSYTNCSRVTFAAGQVML